MIRQLSKSTMSDTEPKTPSDMTRTMEQTMERLQGQFKAISEQLETKLDQMGTRIDGLERNVSELMTQAGTEEPLPPPNQ